MRVQLPDGRVAEFPDDMAPADIERVIQQQFPPADVPAEPEPGPMPPTPPPIPGVVPGTSPERLLARSVSQAPLRVAATVGAPMARTRKALQRTLTGEEVPPGPIEALAAEAHPVARGIGRMAGEIALLAGPGGAGAQLATRAAPAVARALPRATQALGEAAGMAGFEAARAAPGERLEAARGTAGTVLAAHGATRALERTLAGVRKSPEAAKMLKEGVPLTPGQAAKGRVLPWTEERLKEIPFLSKAVRNLEEKAVRRWNRNLLNEVLPPGSPGVPGKVVAGRWQPGTRATGVTSVTESGQAGFRQAQKAFGDAYDDVFRRAAESLESRGLAVDTFGFRVQQTMNRARKNLGKKDFNQLMNFVGPRMATLEKGRSATSLQNFNRKIRDRLTRLTRKGKDDAAEYLDEILQGFEGMIGPQSAARLRDLNTRYVDLDALQRAANQKGAMLQEGMFTPRDLISGAKSKGMPRTTAAGRAPMQEQATAGVRTIGGLAGDPNRMNKYVAGALLVGGGYLNLPLTAATLGAGRAMIREPVRDVMTGGRALTPSTAELLRRWGGRTGAAMAAEGAP